MTDQRELNIRNREAIETLEEAMELVEEARSLARSAINDSTANIAPHYEGYGEYGFNQLLGEGNPYDGSIPKMIKKIREEINPTV